MSNNITIHPSEALIKENARVRAQDVLRRSPVFHSMSVADQKSIYLSLVQEYIDKNRDKHGLARSMATDSGAQMGYKGYDPGLGGDTKAFTELVDSVDFPKFV